MSQVRDLPIFNKKFQFREVTEEFKCTNPFKNHPWQIEELEKLKKQLNGTKNLIKTDRKSWQNHTRYTNSAGAVFEHILKTLKPELLTNAWLKFYEIISEYNCLEINTSKLTSLHLCEAPGGFITSLNHYISLNYSKHEFNWDFHAITLSPWYEGNVPGACITDDRFILETFGNWKFGSNDTGDLMDLENVENLIEQMKGKEISLITADGSINCYLTPGEQESLVVRLIWCEVFTALSILNYGGTLILKMFTMFEHATVSLLYVLRCSFKELHAFKPVTSKEGNSEIYVICINFDKNKNIGDLLKKMSAVFNENTDLRSDAFFFTSELPESFLTDVISCSKLFTKFQEDAILRNLYLYNLSKEEINCAQLRTMKDQVAALYLDKYRLKKISHNNFIAPIQMMKSASRRKMVLGLCSREDDDDLRIPTNTEDIFKLRSALTRIHDTIAENAFLKMEWVNNQKHDWQENISLVYGKNYGVITSSKFCHPQIFLLFTGLLKQDTNKEIQYFLSEEILHQDQQWTTLMAFIAKTPYMTVGEDFEIKSCAYLSRISVASVWAISVFFSKVQFSFESSMELGNIRFCDYNNNSKLLIWLQNLDRSLLNFISIITLCSSPFYEIIFRYNTEMLIKSINFMI